MKKSIFFILLIVFSIPSISAEKQAALLIDNGKHYGSFDEARNKGNTLLLEGSRVNSKENLVLVEGGRFRMGVFVMGDTKNDGLDTTPQHTVILEDFYIGKYEVTQGEYEAVMGNNPSIMKYGIGSDYPVNNVSWFNAVEFCNALSLQEGLEPVYEGSGKDIKCNFEADGYRLPTEAEWEYAARGGQESKRYKTAGSNTIDDVCWYWGNSGDRKLTGERTQNRIEANNGRCHPVGRKNANELGLYDMSGNVCEWCWDWYDENYYDNQNSWGNSPKGPAFSPAAAAMGSRVVRGGSWFSDWGSTYTVDRGNVNPYRRDSYIGFRVLRQQ